MAAERSPDDVEKEHLERIPGEAGHIYHFLWGEVAFLHVAWETYIALYSTNEERIDLMNYCASGFFSDLQLILSDAVQLRIARFLDKERSAGRENASFAGLVRALEGHVTGGLLDQLKLDLEAVQASAASIVLHRHRRIAHLDRELIVGRASSGGTTLKEINEIIIGMVRLMNAVQGHFWGSETVYEYTIQRGGAHDLLIWLEHGRKHDKCPRRTFKVE